MNFEELRDIGGLNSKIEKLERSEKYSYLYECVKYIAKEKCNESIDKNELAEIVKNIDNNLCGLLLNYKNDERNNELKDYIFDIMKHLEYQLNNDDVLCFYAL